MSRLVSPLALVLPALALTAAWGGLHLLGWGEYAVIISGTYVPGAWEGGVPQGLAYATSWYLWVLTAPPLFAASLLWAAWRRLGAART